MSKIFRLLENTLETTPLWQETCQRVQWYWRMQGVRDERQCVVLSDRVMDRLSRHSQLITKQDLPYRAMEEAQRMLNDWLSLALQDQHPAVLAAGRVALLKGTVRNWPDRFVQETPLATADAIALRHALIHAVPPDATLPMPTQVIELFSLQRPIVALWRGLGRAVLALRHWLRQSRVSS